MDTLKMLLANKGRAVFSIQADETVYEAIKEMDARNVGGLIVKNGEKVVGIVTERDYTRKVVLKNRSSKETPVSQIMSNKLVVGTPSTSVEEAMVIMTKKHCRHLPVFEGDWRSKLMMTINH